MDSKIGTVISGSAITVSFTSVTFSKGKAMRGRGRGRGEGRGGEGEEGRSGIVSGSITVSLHDYCMTRVRGKGW